MSNNQNQQQNQQNPYDPAQIAKGLTSANITIPVYGSVFRTTCEQLEGEIEHMFESSLQMPEMNHALVYPEVDARGGLCTVRAFLFFDTTTPGSSITRNGNPNGDGRKTILDYAPIKGVNGEFNTTEKFTSVMSTIAVLDDKEKIQIKSVRDKRIASVEVDFFLLMALCLNISENEPYNFTVLSVDAGRFREGNNANYENAVIVMMKYIDNSRRHKRNTGNGRKIDYRAIDNDFISANRGGGGSRRDY